jgi:NodT family efflux transporter outer membrane factor (OMF) lipoprotein
MQWNLECERGLSFALNGLFVSGMRHLAPELCLIAFVSACAGAPLKPPVVPLPARVEGPAGVAQLTPIELDRWWLLFEDPELNALEDEAFRLSPDARTAAARILEARATAGASVAQTFPTGDLQGNASHGHAYNIGAPSNSLFPVGGTTDTETVNFNVSWEIDLFGRLAQERRAAGADLAATIFEQEGARASLAASVADELFLARGLAIQLGDARENARIETGLEDLAARKATLGLGASADADRVAADLSLARSQVEDLASQLQAARRQLLILVGRGAEPTTSLVIEAVAEDPPPIPQTVPGQLLARRPDIRQADAEIRGQGARSRLRHLAFFPTFTILPGLGASNTTQPGVNFIPPVTLVPAQETTALGLWSLGLGVSAPLLSIPQLKFQAKAEDARTQQAIIAFEKTVQTAYGEAESAVVELAADERRLAILRDGEARARRAADAARARYADGLDELTPALSAEQAWRNTRSALTAERVQALRRAVETYKALGGGWAHAAAVGAKQ